MRRTSADRSTVRSVRPAAQTTAGCDESGRAAHPGDRATVLVRRLMVQPPFDPAPPPAEPPEDCRDIEKWRQGYELYQQHAPDPYGACKLCRQMSPCFLYQLALRSLIDACIN